NLCMSLVIARDPAKRIGYVFSRNVQDKLAGAVGIQDRWVGVVMIVGVIVALVGVPRIRGSGFGIIFDCID
ncbi:MAG TPA: hypothetical protein VN203_14500, partial [Candidatus Acidoferrum sp.]|nr:hypothetical protein [Candidatus Acidoferrum sp.]